MHVIKENKDWAFLEQYRDKVQAVVNTAKKAIPRSMSTIGGMVVKKYFNGHISEIAAISKYLGIDQVDLYAMNLAYEIAQAGWLIQGGCTSAYWGIDGTPYHIRSLDWGWAKELRECILHVRYENEGFDSVTFPGYVGCLTAW